MDRLEVRLAVFVLLKSNLQVLLLQRSPKSYRGGQYTLPSGHVEPGEDIMSAAIRECYEETGIRVLTKDLELKAIIEEFSDTDDKKDRYCHVIFEAKRWHGEAINREVNKHSDLNWFPVNSLPDQTVNYIKQVIHQTSLTPEVFRVID